VRLRDRIEQLSIGDEWEDPAPEELVKYASLNLGFSLPISSPTNSSTKSPPKTDTTSRGGYSQVEYTKYTGASAISSDDFFGRSNPISTSQTSFRYHESTPSASTAYSSSSNNNPYHGAPAPGRGGNSRGRGVRGRGRGNPRGRGAGGAGAGGAGRSPQQTPPKSPTQSPTLSPTQSPTQGEKDEGWEDLNDGGWGEDWGADSNITTAAATDTVTPAPSTTPAPSSASVDDIWNFSASPAKATDVSC